MTRNTAHLTQTISDKVFTTLAVMLKKCLFLRRLKNAGCKAPEILRNEAYLGVRRNDEG